MCLSWPATKSVWKTIISTISHPSNHDLQGETVGDSPVCASLCLYEKLLMSYFFFSSETKYIRSNYTWSVDRSKFKVQFQMVRFPLSTPLIDFIYFGKSKRQRSCKVYQTNIKSNWIRSLGRRLKDILDVWICWRIWGWRIHLHRFAVCIEQLWHVIIRVFNVQRCVLWKPSLGSFLYKPKQELLQVFLKVFIIAPKWPFIFLCTLLVLDSDIFQHVFLVSFQVGMLLTLTE